MPPVGPLRSIVSTKPLANNSQYVHVFPFRGLRDPEINDIRKNKVVLFSDYVLPDSAPPLQAIQAPNIHIREV